MATKRKSLKFYLAEWRGNFSRLNLFIILWLVIIALGWLWIVSLSLLKLFFGIGTYFHLPDRGNFFVANSHFIKNIDSKKRTPFFVTARKQEHWLWVASIFLSFFPIHFFIAFIYEKGAIFYWLTLQAKFQSKNRKAV